MVCVNVKVKLTHVYTARTYINEVDMTASTQNHLFLTRHRLCTPISYSSSFIQTQNILPLNGHYFEKKENKVVGKE